MNLTFEQRNQKCYLGRTQLLIIDLKAPQSGILVLEKITNEKTSEVLRHQLLEELNY